VKEEEDEEEKKKKKKKKKKKEEGGRGGEDSNYGCVSQMVTYTKVVDQNVCISCLSLYVLS
jgi:hypothetical protein